MILVSGLQGIHDRFFSLLMQPRMFSGELLNEISFIHLITQGTGWGLLAL